MFKPCIEIISYPLRVDEHSSGDFFIAVERRRVESVRLNKIKLDSIRFSGYRIRAGNIRFDGNSSESSPHLYDVVKLLVQELRPGASFEIELKFCQDQTRKLLSDRRREIHGFDIFFAAQPWGIVLVHLQPEGNGIVHNPGCCDLYVQITF